MSARSLIASLPKRLDPGTVEAVRLHCIDTLAALEAGIGTREGRMIADFYAGSDKATISAGMAAVARFSECDDIEVPSCLTPGCIAVPVGLVCAPNAGDFERSVVAGYAVGLALARACGGVDALARGIWPTLLAAPAIAAVSGARARRLEDEQAVQALVLSLAGHSGRAGRPAGEPSGRWLALGEAVLKGLRAVDAVEAGFAGDTELLSAQWLATQTEASLAAPAHLDAVTQEPVRRVGLKSVVSARQGANAIEALLAMIADGLNPHEIDAIEVDLPEAAVSVVTRPLDLASRLSRIAHLGLQLALAVHEPRRLMDADRRQPFQDRTLAFVDKVSVRGNPDLGTGDASFPAMVRVTAGDRIVEKRCARLPGDAGAPGVASVLEAKLKRLSSGPELAGLLTSLADGDAFFTRARDAASALTGRRMMTDTGGGDVARFA